MLGLIEKDLRLALTRRQILAFFFIAAMLMGISVDASFLISYLTLFATIVAVGTMNYDESDNGLAFLMTLPFDRKTYVREKYLFCLIMATAMWCIGAVLYFVINTFRGIPSDLSELPLLVSIIPTIYLSAAIMIPLQLKYGSEKSRIVLFIIFGIFAILIIAAKNVVGDSDIPFIKLEEFLDGLSPAIILLTLAGISALISFISYLCSVRIMENKEF